MIPKIIHQTAPRNKAEWNPIWEECQFSWKKNFPDFEYVFWDDEDLRNLIKNNYSQFISVYDSCEYNIMRVDFARLCILHKYGGIYADMDFYCYGNFYDLLIGKDVFLVESWPEWGEKVQNSLMASVPKQNFWMMCCEKIVENILLLNNNIFDYKDILNCCGPIALSQLINNEIGILPKHLFNPQIQNQFNYAHRDYKSVFHKNALEEFYYLNNKEIKVFTRHYLTGMWTDKTENGIFKS